MTVTRAGKNLFDPNSTGNDWIGNNFVTSHPTGCKSVQLPASAGQSWSASMSNTRTTTNLLILVFFDGNNNVLARNLVVTNGKTLTATAPANTETVLCSLYTYSEAGNVQLELGTSATAYEPYVGQTYPATWETEAGTVYGGTLDVVSGVLTVDRAIVDMGTLNYTYDSSGGRFYTSVSGKKNESSDSEMMLAISSMYKPMTATAFQSNPTNGTMRGATVGGYCYFRNNEYTDAASFKTAMAGQTLCYELATPQTYNLTPEQVTMLLGNNYLVTEDGTITLTYMVGK
jgi:hypothetical protein